jgi:hypothetical protein
LYLIFLTSSSWRSSSTRSWPFTSYWWSTNSKSTRNSWVSSRSNSSRWSTTT